MSAQNPPCQGVNRALFHSDDINEQRQAAEECHFCPLMIQCKAKGQGEAYGVWGGLTEWERPDAQAYETQRLADAEAIAVAAEVEAERLARLAATVREGYAEINALIDGGMSFRNVARETGYSNAHVDRCRADYKRRAAADFSALVAA